LGVIRLTSPMCCCLNQSLRTQLLHLNKTCRCRLHLFQLKQIDSQCGVTINYLQIRVCKQSQVKLLTITILITKIIYDNEDITDVVLLHSARIFTADLYRGLGVNFTSRGFIGHCQVLSFNQI